MSLRLPGPPSGTQIEAERRGIKAFDTALPQGWVDAVAAKTGFDTFGQFVWSYDPPFIFGVPVPVTDAGEVILAWFQSLDRHGRSLLDEIDTDPDLAWLDARRSAS